MFLPTPQHPAMPSTWVLSGRVDFSRCWEVIGWGRVLLGGFLFRDRKSLGERREQLASYKINPEHVLDSIRPSSSPAPRCRPPALPGGQLTS